MLTCGNISIKVSDKPLLNGIGFSILEGGMLVIQGKNGSGKSSFLKVLASIIDPHAGKILYNKKDINDDIAHYIKHVSYLGHKNPLIEDRTVEENLHFWGKLYHRSRNLSVVLSYMKLFPIQRCPIYQLSAGWKRRVSLGILLLTSCPVWILDEPMSHLDQEGCMIMMSMISAHLEQGGIVILSSPCPIEIPNKKVSHLILENYSYSKAKEVDHD